MSVKGRCERWFRRFARVGPKNFLELLLQLLLLPLSYLYGFISLLRCNLYRHNILQCYETSIPIVSIGNLVMGGTGKTPITDYVARLAVRHGYRPVIVSRGYGGGYREKYKLVSDGQKIVCEAQECGDEPYLLARRNPGIPVVVARKRKDALLFAELFFSPNLFILDDAYQHLSVRRDFDVLLLDAECPYGNGQVFPAGYLREFVRVPERGQVLFMNRTAQEFIPKGVPEGIVVTTLLAKNALNFEDNPVAISALLGKKILAFSGVADNDRFFFELRSAGLNIIEIAFPDHQRYDSAVISLIRAAAQSVEYLITTEKDWVKVAGADLGKPLLRVPLEVIIADETKFCNNLLQSIKR